MGTECRVAKAGERCVALFLRRQRPASRKGLHGLLDTGNLPGPTGRLRRGSRDPREHGLPVGAHLGSPGKARARMRRLLAAVVLVEQTSCGIKIMSVCRLVLRCGGRR